MGLGALKKLALVHLLIFAHLPLAAFAQAGWQGIPWGANPELAQALSQHQLIKQPFNRVGSEYYVGFTIPRYEIDGDAYQVNLVFSSDENRMTAVVVDALGHERGTRDAIVLRDRAGKLERRLTERYGAPQVRKDDLNSPLGGKLERVWAMADVKVTLVLVVGLWNRLAVRYDAP